MYDFSIANEKPGTCSKCNGSGEFRWGALTNGKPSKSGPCHSCRGTGMQDRKQIARNHSYNRYKIALVASY